MTTLVLGADTQWGAVLLRHFAGAGHAVIGTYPGRLAPSGVPGAVAWLDPGFPGSTLQAIGAIGSRPLDILVLALGEAGEGAAMRVAADVRANLEAGAGKTLLAIGGSENFGAFMRVMARAWRPLGITCLTLVPPIELDQLDRLLHGH